MIRPHFRLLFASVTIALAGCDSAETGSTPIVENHAMASTKIDVDPALSQEVSVLNFKESKEGNLLTVSVELENQQFKSTDFNFQFAWYHADGSEVDSPPPLWKPGFILARERISIRGVAPFETVTDFRLKLVSRATYNSTIAKRP